MQPQTNGTIRAEKTRLVRKLERGSFLHLAGDAAGNSVHLLESGLLKLVARAEDGRESIVDLVLPGEVADDIAAIDGLPHAFDAIAVVDSTVVVLDPAVSSELVAASLAARVRRLGSAVHERSGSAREALAGRLAELARAGARSVPLAQADLGRLAGTSRETVCRELARLRRTGAVSYRSRSVRILRPELLDRLRCG
ncbi:MAG TPA: Crp/Fnr family transcriptional regulator [Actinomycetota bacterium]|nr:Crp/Fnr family transcriptional regulator [Actinomycetota bacterium]